MSSYLTTYNTVVKNEGGYALPFGKSGETYKGIDRLYHKDWPGWKIIDAYKATHQLRQYDVIANVDLENWVAAFYKSYLERHVNIESISSQPLADMVADFLIHKQYDAIKVINWTAGKFLVKDVSANSITPAVIQVMNNYSTLFYTLLKNARILYYQNPKSFGSGIDGFSASLTAKFINRVNSFPATA